MSKSGPAGGTLNITLAAEATRLLTLSDSVS